MGDKHVGLGAGAVLVGYGRVRRERGEGRGGRSLRCIFPVGLLVVYCGIYFFGKSTYIFAAAEDRA